MLILAEWVLPITGEPISGGGVALQDGVIVAVGRAAEIKGQYPAGEVLDLGRSLLLPGLVNCHAHLEYTLLKGLFDGLAFDQWLASITAISRSLSREELSLSARWGAAEAIRAGTTCIGDTTPSGITLEVMGEAGLRGVVYQELFGTAGEEAAHKVEEGLERLNAWPTSRYPRLRGGLAPHAPYTAGPELLREAAEAAAVHDLPLCLHLAEVTDELALQVPGQAIPPSRARGQRPVPYAASLGFLSPRLLAVHCVHLDWGDAETLALYGVRVVHCPRSNARLGHGIAPLDLMKKAGVAVGLGTDSAVSGGNLDLLEEARAAVWLQRASRLDSKALGAAEVVGMATLGGAKALGLESKVGSLEVGKYADLVGFSLSGLRPGAVNDPFACLVYHLGPAEVNFVMVGGEVLLRDGVLQTIDEGMLEREGQGFARRLAALASVSGARDSVAPTHSIGREGGRR